MLMIFGEQDYGLAVFFFLLIFVTVTVYDREISKKKKLLCINLSTSHEIKSLRTRLDVYFLANGYIM